jgi:hypothetical protein
MTKGNYYNSDSRTLTWPTLTHPDTLTTLRLEPGETVENLFVPWGFKDPFLKPLSVQPVGDQTPDEVPTFDPNPPPAEDSPAEPSEEG